MARIDDVPVPPSRTPRPRSARVPDSVLRRYETFLERVRGRRQALGLTQEDVADRLGVSNSHLANLERGYSVLSVPKLFALADVLKTTPSELLMRQRSDKPLRR